MEKRVLSRSLQTSIDGKLFVEVLNSKLNWYQYRRSAVISWTATVP
jgi:hypothetical protein